MLDVENREMIGPLSRYAVARTRDQDEFKTLVAGVFRDHGLSLLRRSGLYDAELSHCPLGDMSVNFVSYGAEAVVDPGSLDFYLIHVPLRGISRVDLEGETFHATPDAAVICSPAQRVRFQWSDDCGVLAIRIEQAAVARQLSQMLGEPVKRMPVFSPKLPFGPDSSWRNLSRFICRELDKDRNLFATAQARASIEQMLISTLLLQHDHDLRDLLDRPASPAAPRHVRRAEEFMAARLTQGVGIAEVVAAAGVSERTLFEGFRQFRNTSPMAWMKARRLEKAREALARGAGANVTEIAMEWGFYHLGNFSADYRAQFGERPSDTLKRALDQA